MGDDFETRLRNRAEAGDINLEEIVDLLDNRDRRIKDLYNSLVTVVEKKNDIFDIYLQASQILEREDGIHRKVSINQYNNFYLIEVSGE